MSKYRVTIEVEVNGLPDAEARGHARWLAERHGLDVVSTSVVKSKEEGTAFLPKSGTPGSVLTRQGRSFQVWSKSQYMHSVWAVPTERRPGDAPVYLIGTRSSDGYASPFRSNGQPWGTKDADAHKEACAA